jgi:hypothetical protein
MGRLYGYPALGRFGLGHSLMAWARCHIWCKGQEAAMLGPIWLRPRLGPYLRRERDKREYFKLFNNNGYIGEPLRSWLLLTSHKIEAENISLENVPCSDLIIHEPPPILGLSSRLQVRQPVGGKPWHRTGFNFRRG